MPAPQKTFEPAIPETQPLPVLELAQEHTEIRQTRRYRVTAHGGIRARRWQGKPYQPEDIQVTLVDNTVVGIVVTGYLLKKDGTPSATKVSDNHWRMDSDDMPEWLRDVLVHIYDLPRLVIAKSTPE